MRLHIGQTLRYPATVEPEIPLIDGLPNFYHITYSPYGNSLNLQRGIYNPSFTSAVDGTRLALVNVTSSPHKIGSHETPWQDIFDSDNGYIRYYGDNKNPSRDPATARGNARLLNLFQSHHATTAQERAKAVPLVFFRRVSRGGIPKGFLQFQGYGLIRGAHLVSQYDRKQDRTFPNFAFDFTVLEMRKDGEAFDWSWINARRDPNLPLNETLKVAPSAWREWIQSGDMERFRRRVSKLMTVETKKQRPETAQDKNVLLQIYERYTKTKKALFEGLALKVTAQILSANGCDWLEGWVTPSTSDGGADFVGRVDLGSEFSRVKLVVLGQAKCEDSSTPTNGQHIARTVARLKRGWIGSYVTTSYFSEAVQREVLEDQYPILLVHGLRLAQEVQKMADHRGCSVETLLSLIDAEYDSLIAVRRPEELLLQ